MSTEKLEKVTVTTPAEDLLEPAQSAMRHPPSLTNMVEVYAGIVHETIQPLTTIANYSAACSYELAKIDDARLDGVRQWIQTIKEQSLRAADIIRSLRRPLEQRAPLLNTIGVEELVHETLDLLASELHESNARVRLSFPSKNIPMHVDRVQIQQVLTNLVRNACEAMTEVDALDRIVTLTVSNCGGHVRFSVADRGPGIDDSLHERVLEPFVTAKDGGMGMGLAICAKIVKAHGGFIHGTNNGSGAVFSFTIPAGENRHDE